MGCSRSGPTSGITSDQQYREMLEKTRILSAAPLARVEAGEPLDEVSVKALIEAQGYFDQMSTYTPEKLGPYLGAMKISHALGNDQDVLTRFGKLGDRLDLPPKTPEDIAVRGALFGEAARSSNLMGKFEDGLKYASEAVVLDPANPNYAAELASANLQLKHTEEARKIVEGALKTAPDHPRLRDLKKLLDMGAAGAKP